MTAGAAARIERARLLAAEQRSCAEVLAVYASLVGVPQSLIESAPAATQSRESPTPLARVIDPQALAALVPRFLTWLCEAGNPHQADAAKTLERIELVEWRQTFRHYIDQDPAAASMDDISLFVVEGVLQPFAEQVALGWMSDHPTPSDPPSQGSVDGCPLCGSQPVVATLREQGHGSRRSFVCGLCLLEFRARRIACLSCGQSDFDALPIYRTDALPGVRLDACEACHTYIKTIDLTQSTRAIPVVDDLATLPLDLWARERGYRKLRPNILRL